VNSNQLLAAAKVALSEMIRSPEYPNERRFTEAADALDAALLPDLSYELVRGMTPTELYILFGEEVARYIAELRTTNAILRRLCNKTQLHLTPSGDIIEDEPVPETIYD
jgi:hypothetical protein